MAKFNLIRKQSILSIVFCSLLILLFQNCGSDLDPVSLNESPDTTNLSCPFNGSPILSGDSVEAYEFSTHANCNSIKQTRVCQNGALSGVFPFASCARSGFQSCLFNGLTILHNQPVSAYRASTVPFGSTCMTEIRTCNDGVLSTLYPINPFVFNSCEVGGPASCSFFDETFVHGTVLSTFATPVVPFGSVCQNQGRTCNNGALSGSYEYKNCSVAPPANCAFSGGVVNHGASVNSYLAPTSYGCEIGNFKVLRTCNNGTLSFGYDYATCVNPEINQTPCLFNGKTYTHGESSINYFTSSSLSTDPNRCSSEIRICSNGVLSGTATFNSCTLTYPSIQYGSKTIADGQMILFNGIINHGSFAGAQAVRFVPEMINSTRNSCLFMGVRNIQGVLYQGQINLRALPPEKCRNPIMGTPIQMMEPANPTYSLNQVPASPVSPLMPTTVYPFVVP